MRERCIVGCKGPFCFVRQRRERVSLRMFWRGVRRGIRVEIGSICLLLLRLDFVRIL
jgi:hypothetical protein